MTDRRRDSFDTAARAFAPRQNSCTTTATTNAASTNIASDCQSLPACEKASSSTSPTAAAISGPWNTRRMPASVTRRQAITGPIPDKSTSTSASGTVYRSNHGGPTLDFVPVTASEISGKNVPQKITKQSPTSTRLFKRNTASRENKESIFASERRSSRRDTTNPTESTSTSPMNVRNGTPRVE